MQRLALRWTLQRGLATTAVKEDPPLTEERYSVNRGNYNQLSSKHKHYFEQLLGRDEARVLTDPHDVHPHNVDWLNSMRGRSSIVLRPKSTQEVSALLKYCNEQRLAVCPQGGNTGLVGGSTPVFDEVIISTSLMNKIFNIDSAAGVLTCQSGCVLETLDRTLEQHGLMMPLDMGSKGSCNIGGNVATNAGGLRLLRYGSLHNTVLGLELVQANGDILDLLSTLKKDNTGYHLKNLFIGSEGTLGMITAVAIQCPPFPKAVNLAFLGLNSFENVIATFELAKSMVSEVLSATEMIDAPSINACLDQFGYTRPIGKYPFYMVIETQGSHMAHDEKKLQLFLQKAMDENIVEDGVVASEPSKIRHLWEIREKVPVAIPKLGFTLKYDVSLPLLYFYSVVPEIQNRIGDEGIAFGYGHVGDGNIHLNVVLPKFKQEIVDKIEPYVYGHTRGPHWAKAATELKGKVKLGALDATVHSSKASQYGVQGYPTIKFFGPGKKHSDSVLDYDGGRTSNDIVTWALDKLAENIPAPEIIELINEEVASKACLKAPLCIISVLPHILDCNAECRNEYIAILKTMGEKYKKKMWGWLWTEAGAQSEVENVLEIGGFGYPAMAVVNIKKKKYSLLRGAFSEDGINDFLKDISYGRGHSASVKREEMPKINSVEPWDGKDGVLPVEDDIDLSDIDLDEKDEL